MAYEIRTLGIGGILDSTFQLFRDHFKFIVIVTAVLFFPVTLAFALAQAVVAPEAYLEISTVGEGAETPEANPAQVIESLSRPVTFVVSALVEGALACGLVARIRGKNMGPGEAIRVALRRSPGLVWLNMLYGIGVFAGLLLFIVPGIIFSFMWYVVVPVYMLEGLSARKSFERSARLMKGQKGKAFAVNFLIGIVLLGASFLLGFSVRNVYALSVLGAVLMSLIRAVQAVVATVMYISARCANDNFDLELVAESLEEGTRETVSPL